MPEYDNLPCHVGIIMDGNGRWAKKQGLPRNAGHKKGADAFAKIVRHAADIGIGHLTAYAFSTENWKRPPEEVAGIMDLLRSYLADAERHRGENVRIGIIGEKSRLDADLREKIAQLEFETASSYKAI